VDGFKVWLQLKGGHKVLTFDDVLSVAIIVGLGWMFYQKVVKGDNHFMSNFRDKVSSTFSRDNTTFGRGKI
jgi:hypothetical protein